jgi:hypothetical protein
MEKSEKSSSKKKSKTPTSEDEEDDEFVAEIGDMPLPTQGNYDRTDSVDYGRRDILTGNVSVTP